MQTKHTEKHNSSPKTLTVDKVRTIYADLSIDEPTATTFIPEFNSSVLCVGPTENFPLNPDYALTIPSTMALMLILADLEPVGSLAPPITFSPASPYSYSQDVPWLTFENGAVRNAGQLAIYWKSNNGDPGGKAAENNARLDIAWG